MKEWIIEWLSEKTTWGGAIALATAFGMPELTDPQQAALIAFGASLFAMNDRIKKS
jgi:hypothetical protein